MANWEDIINDRIMNGRARPLFYAVNALRRGRSGGEKTRGNTILGEGDCPKRG